MIDITGSYLFTIQESLLSETHRGVGCAPGARQPAARYAGKMQAAARSSQRPTYGFDQLSQRSRDNHPHTEPLGVRGSRYPGTLD